MEQLQTVSVIIPTFHRYKYLGDLLTMLSDQTVKPLEIIIVDQTPEQERPKDFYEQFQGHLPIRRIDIQKASLTYPRNLAALRALGAFLLFLDDDIVIGKDFIEAHLKVMREQNVDVVNGAVTRKDQLPKGYPWNVNVLDPVRFFLAAPNYQWEGMMLGVSSCNVLIKKDSFLAVGGFDEYLPRMVDFELGYRLFRHGAKIYFSYKPFARHLRGEGGSRKNPKHYNKLVSAFYIHYKHFPGWITTQFMLKHIMTWKIFFKPWFLVILWMAMRRARVLLRSSKAKRIADLHG